MNNPLDHKYVNELVRELTVALRNGLNTSDTLADLKDFSKSEKGQVICTLDRKGYLLANDEILEIVQRRPKSFADLVASVKIQRNEDLLMKIWDCVKKYFGERNRPDLLDKLKLCVDRISQKHISEPVQQGYNGDSSERDAPGIDPGPERLMIKGPDAVQSGNPDGRGTSPKIIYLRNDSAYSGLDRSQNFLAEQDQADALGKLTPEATPDKSSSPFVGGGGDGSQPVPTCATPDQNNFADVQLMKVSSRILRAVGKEIGNNWPDILEHLNLEISMEDDTRIENATSPGYKFLQHIGALKLPGNERITVRQLSNALLHLDQVTANEILFRKIDRRSGPLHQSFSEMGINQMQGAIGGTPSDRGDNQQMNIEPFRSLPVESNLEDQTAIHKSADGIKTLNIFAPRSSENIDNSTRPDSLRSSYSNLPGLQSPGPSSSSSGNLPHIVNDPNIHMATGSYDASQDPGASIDSTAGRDNIRNLKEYPARPAIDQGMENTAFNPDTEHLKLQADAELQSTALGHSPGSHGYEDIHPREQARDNTHAAATVDPQDYSYDNVSRLQTPDLGSIVPTSVDESLRYGSDIMPIPRGDNSQVVTSQQGQVDIMPIPRGDNTQVVTSQQGQGQGQGHQLQGEGDSNQGPVQYEGCSVGLQSQGQDQTELHESQGQGQNDVAIEANLNNESSEVSLNTNIDNVADLNTKSLCLED